LAWRDERHATTNAGFPLCPSRKKTLSITIVPWFLFILQPYCSIVYFAFIEKRLILSIASKGITRMRIVYEVDEFSNGMSWPFFFNRLFSIEAKRTMEKAHGS
jgi:hypothetical protein